MTFFNHRPTLRWLVPLVAALLLAAGGSAIGVITAAARSGLPSRSAAQLLVDVQKARLDGLSGTIVQNANLGLPSLPGVGGSGSSDMTSLVSGSHMLRLWYAGPDHVRLALQGSLGESDVVRNGTDVWTWASADKSATHRTMSSSSSAADKTPQRLASGSPVTPQQAADMALKAVSPTTKVTPEGTAIVAGRSAYELLLAPKDTGSLVGSVRIAIDGKTHVPTRVQVFAKNANSPAFEVGFTSFDPTSPALSRFRFNPPPGTKVTESSKNQRRPAAADKGRTGRSASGAAPKVVGSGWTSVVVARVPSGAASGSSAMTGTLAKTLKVLPKVRGSWGSGHLLRGALFSALLTDDGRVAVGAVSPDALYAALAGR